MPRSRVRKKAKPKTPPGNGGVVFQRMSFDGIDHEKLKQALLESARKSLAELPGHLAELQRMFRETSPEDIVSTFAFYGAHGSISEKGETRSFAKDILQHHIELLQALMLTVPVSEWGYGPNVANVMQTVFDTVPKITDTLMHRRMLEQDTEPDEAQRAAKSLQEKIRLHTQAVRNWAHYSDVIKISRELYAPLDPKFLSILGFATSDVIDIGEMLVSELERRAAAHIAILRKVIRCKSTAPAVASYYEHAPGLVGTPEEFIAALPPEIGLRGVKALIMSHSDLRHSTNMTFTVKEVAALCDKPEELVSKVLDNLCHLPGALEETNVDHLFLANPVWTRPGVKTTSGYLFAIPQAIFSHITDIIQDMASQSGLATALSDRRARYLEDKLADTLAEALPTAQISKNVKWSLGDQQYETDVAAHVDRTLVLAEAKSHRLSPQGMRGAPDRLKRHLGDLVVNPSLQSERFANLVRLARAGDADSLKIVKGTGIDPANVDHIIRISVTLDDLSILSSSEDELKEVGWIPKDHELAPSLHIADLICIADILDSEILFLHYFAERFHFQKAFELLGDELDFLGLYLESGFNFGPRREDFTRMAISGMSAPIDRYYEGGQVGLNLPKPKAKLRASYRALLVQLSDRKPLAWTTAGIHLLASASFKEQQRIDQALLRLKKAVSQKSRKPGDDCYMEISPALDRKAAIGFYVYSENEKHNRKQDMEQLSARALEREDAQTIVIFGKNIDNWNEAYECFMFAQKEPDSTI